MLVKIDLHTHSIVSPDGGLAIKDYEQALNSKRLDFIAITDHNTVDFALFARQKLGSRIIVGEEIMTTNGEIIGLYLQSTIPAGLTPAATVVAIRQQNGLVYIPHPFEKVRSGLQVGIMAEIKDEIDIVEVFNGRALNKNTTKNAAEWARQHQKSGASSSDTHGRRGWQRTYSTVNGVPSRENLVKLLQNTTLVQNGVGFGGLLYPKFNRYIRRNRQWKK